MRDQRSFHLGQRKSPTVHLQSKLSDGVTQAIPRTNFWVYRNLYYIEYLQTNDPITPAAFELIWSELPKEIVKVSPEINLVKVVNQILHRNTPH